MESVTLIFQGQSYSYKHATNIEMSILGCFFATDVGCEDAFYRDWIFDSNRKAVGGNLTDLYKEGTNIFLSDIYSEEKAPIELKMTIKQFVQILDDWRDKVCKKIPREVIIKYDNDVFTIKTSD